MQNRSLTVLLISDKSRGIEEKIIDGKGSCNEHLPSTVKGDIWAYLIIIALKTDKTYFFQNFSVMETMAERLKKLT